jgi:hypothetical protein
MPMWFSVGTVFRGEIYIEYERISFLDGMLSVDKFDHQVPIDPSCVNAGLIASLSPG